MPADPRRVVSDLLELRSLTSQPVDGIPQTVGGKPWTDKPLGSARLAWTEPWVKARAWFADSFDGIPVETTTDPAGNLWVTLRGARPERIVLGSHLDSVPNGGWLDGCLGVLAGAGIGSVNGNRALYNITVRDGQDVYTAFNAAAEVVTQANQHLSAVGTAAKRSVATTM